MTTFKERNLTIILETILNSCGFFCGMPEEELKNLPPEEKIRRLKEREEKKRKEIEEAQKMLREAEKELSDKEEWRRKVPIPQVAAERVEEMSEAEKEIIKAHRGLRRGRGVKGEEEERKEEGEEEGRRRGREERSLEETIAKEKGFLEGLRETEYAAKLSRAPIETLYEEMKGMREEAEERGYVSAETVRRVEYRLAATERKLEDIGAGRYNLTEEVAEAALLTRMVGMGTNIIESYRKRREG